MELTNKNKGYSMKNITIILLSVSMIFISLFVIILVQFSELFYPLGVLFAGCCLIGVPIFALMTTAKFRSEKKNRFSSDLDIH